MSNSQFLLAVFAMGVVTYGTRLAGYWFLRDVPVTGRFKAVMDSVPPAILTAVIAPQVFLQGAAEMIAGAIALAAAVLRLPLLVVIGIGVASVATLRLWN